MRTVITHGAFDLFHIRRVHLLARLREMGEGLVAGCSTDEFNAAKGKTSVMPYELASRTFDCRRAGRSSRFFDSRPLESRLKKEVT